MRPMLLETVEKATCKDKGLLCKIQEIPILDVVLKLIVQCQETYLELEGLGFRFSLFVIII